MGGQLLKIKKISPNNTMFINGGGVTIDGSVTPVSASLNNWAVDLDYVSNLSYTGWIML
jgi:hypothetical protein